jgi:hypothetical protein
MHSPSKNEKKQNKINLVRYWKLSESSIVERDKNCFTYDFLKITGTELKIQKIVKNAPDPDPQHWSILA